MHANAATIIIMDNNMGTYINKCYKEPSSHSRLYNNPKMPYIRTLVIRYNNKGLLRISGFVSQGFNLP